VHQKFRLDRVDGDDVYVRARGADTYRSFTAEDERALFDSFVRYRRDRFWDL
jgi:hypothetical protein